MCYFITRVIVSYGTYSNYYCMNRIMLRPCRTTRCLNYVLLLYVRTYSCISDTCRLYHPPSKQRSILLLWVVVLIILCCPRDLVFLKSFWSPCEVLLKSFLTSQKGKIVFAAVWWSFVSGGGRTNITSHNDKGYQWLTFFSSCICLMVSVNQYLVHIHIAGVSYISYERWWYNTWRYHIPL